MGNDRMGLGLAQLEVERAADVREMVAELEGATTASADERFVASGTAEGKGNAPGSSPTFVASGKVTGKGGTPAFEPRFLASGKSVAGKRPTPGRFIASGKTPAKRQG